LALYVELICIDPNPTRRERVAQTCATLSSQDILKEVASFFKILKEKRVAQTCATLSSQDILKDFVFFFKILKGERVAQTCATLSL
jgi:hypothetical protein